MEKKNIIKIIIGIILLIGVFILSYGNSFRYLTSDKGDIGVFTFSMFITNFIIYFIVVFVIYSTILFLINKYKK